MFPAHYQVYIGTGRVSNVRQTEELLQGRQATKLKMDSLKSASLTKADGSTVDAATALQQKVLIIEN